MSKLPVQKNVNSIELVEACEPYFGEPIGERPEQRISVMHFDEAKGLMTGIWECEPGRLKLDLDVDEFCHIVAGHWVMTSDEGEITEVKPGDSFVFPRGWKGSCEVKEKVRKVFTVLL